MGLLTDLLGDGVASSDVVKVMGDPAAPISDPNAAKTTTGPTLWYMANGVTPTNAETGDVIATAVA